jgi:hypothetical protein
VEDADVDVDPDNADFGSTPGGAGDVETRDGNGVCPIDASRGGGGGGIDDRGKRTVDADAKCGAVEGTGVGLRKPGTGVGLRCTDGGCGVARPSALGGTVDFRVERTVEGGSGVVRFSGGGIVDLRVKGTAEGGSGVVRLFSDGGIVDLRDDAGSSVERTTPASSSVASNISPLRGSVAGVCIEERRDEPRAELCG